MNTMELVKIAILEDLPKGDITTESLALKPKQGRALLKAKEDLVLSGTLPFEQSFLTLEPNLKTKWHFDEGDNILKGQNICTLQGDLIQLLKAERVALNFLGHLSGIATYTQKFVRAIGNSKTQILDTRKTLPGYRELEKKAVVHGGGFNHRLNLGTAILIKDNHIAMMGGIAEAIQRVRKHTSLPIEVEASNLEEVQQACQQKVHRILLDNMSDEMIQKSMQLIPKSISVEASGNMNLERVPSVAALGVDFISIGALTHSAPVADVSLEFEIHE